MRARIRIIRINWLRSSGNILEMHYVFWIWRYFNFSEEVDEKLIILRFDSNHPLLLRKFVRCKLLNMAISHANVRRLEPELNPSAGWVGCRCFPTSGWDCHLSGSELNCVCDGSVLKFFGPCCHYEVLKAFALFSCHAVWRSRIVTLCHNTFSWTCTNYTSIW